MSLRKGKGREKGKESIQKENPISKRTGQGTSERERKGNRNPYRKETLRKKKERTHQPE